MARTEKVEKDPANFKEFLASKKGEILAVLCARYHYRGRVTMLAEDCFTLANATMVEVSGTAASATAQSEDPYRGDITIKYDAIEMAHQANWVNSPLPGEN